MIKRGDVYISQTYINSNGELGKVRPVLILENSREITKRGYSLIAPITSKTRMNNIGCCSITKREKLDRDSTILFQNIHYLKRSEILHYVAHYEEEIWRTSLLEVFGLHKKVISDVHIKRLTIDMKVILWEVIQQKLPVELEYAAIEAVKTMSNIINRIRTSKTIERICILDGITYVISITITKNKRRGSTVIDITAPKLEYYEEQINKRQKTVTI